jgi:hypothetical protein
MPKSLTKVEKLGLGTTCMEMRARGFSYQDIEKSIKTQYNQDVNWQVIRNFLQKSAQRGKEVVARRADLQTSEAEQRAQIIQDCTRLKDDMWNFFEDLKNRQQDANVIKAANHLLLNLQTLAKLLGVLREEHYKVTYNVIDLAPKINQVIIAMRKRGSFKCRHCGSTDIQVKEETIGV